MNRIHVLSEHVANKIAAGEVVERPASVVKELVENSLDAGATQIDIEIRGGGLALIQVADNGHGMSPGDARLCFERHATSKIKDVDDIYSISTLGFRGEALPSIASVSHVEMVTCEKGAKEGTRLQMEAGKKVIEEAAAPSPGTRISVANLFFNTPARRKFLKGERTEMNHITATVQLAAMAHNKTGFKLTDAGRVILDVPRDADLKERLRILFGKEFAKELLEIRIKRDEAKIKGFVGKPSLNRSNRMAQYFFVNARPIQSRNLSFSLSQGFDTLMMVNRFPVGVIFIEVDPDKVDVNIHPTKKEVKFSDEERIRSLLVRAVKEALSEADLKPSLRKTQQAKFKVLNPDEKNFVHPQGSVDPGSFSSRLQEAIVSYMGGEDLPAQPSLPVSEPPAGDGDGGIESSEASGLTLTKILGVIHDTYIVCETAEGMILIDQHAAHERLLFEQVILDFEKGNAPSQRLLLPDVVELTAAEAALLEPFLPSLNKIGMSVASFGANSFVIDALPAYFKSTSVTNLLREMVGEIESWGKVSAPEKAREKIAAMVSCKAAVKAHDRLKPEERDRLVNQAVLHLQNKTCPHGRPIMISLSADDLAREFKRK